MNRDIDLQHILQAYLDSDSKLQEEEKIAQSQIKQDRQKSCIANGYAYFVLLFSYLEGHINEQCELIIQQKCSSQNWKERRYWDSIKDVSGISFKNRVSYLTDKSGNDYHNICSFYKVRCDLAHGGLPQPVHVPTFIAQLKKYIATLKA
jgi:hypothetical protein